MKILSEPIDALVKFKGREKPIPYKFRYLDEEEVYHEIKYIIGECRWELYKI